MWVGQQEDFSDDTPERDDASSQRHPQAALEGATQHPLDDDDEGPPRTDYDADMPETESAVRRELLGLRANACFYLHPDYLGKFANDLMPAETPEDELDAALQTTDESWMAVPLTFMGRESALITKLAQLRLGDDFVETEHWLDDLRPADQTPPPVSPPAEAVEAMPDEYIVAPEVAYALARLFVLRTLEQSDFTLDPDPLEEDAAGESPDESDDESDTRDDNAPCD